MVHTSSHDFHSPVSTGSMQRDGQILMVFILWIVLFAGTYTYSPTTDALLS